MQKRMKRGGFMLNSEHFEIRLPTGQACFSVFCLTSCVVGEDLRCSSLFFRFGGETLQVKAEKVRSGAVDQIKDSINGFILLIQDFFQRGFWITLVISL